MNSTRFNAALLAEQADPQQRVKAANVAGRNYKPRNLAKSVTVE